MRVLVIDRYYDACLRDLAPRMSHGSYEERWRAAMDAAFGTADFYSRNLAALGHEATEIVSNSLLLQSQWAREHGRLPLALRLLGSRATLPPGAERLADEVAIQQARAFAPDVVHVQDPLALSDRLFRGLKATARLVVGQIASAYPSTARLKRFDLLVSSLPSFIADFRSAGIAAEYLPLGFESSLAARVERSEVNDVVFVGGVTAVHPLRNALLERLASELPLAWWGYGAEQLPASSALRRSFRGAAWGIDALRAIASGRICFNAHAAFAGPYANNMRLYEATGVGTMLLTDAKENLATMFEPGREVVAFASDAEVVPLARRYVERDDERRAIAAAGQARTLSEHTYARVMEAFVHILARYL